jgi:hypothetical protein
MHSPKFSPECRPGRETGSGLGYLFSVSITTFFRTTSPARLRAGARAGVIAAATSAPLLVASAALASNHNYDGEDSGSGLTVLQTLGIYLGIPLGLFLLIAFLVVLPGWVRGDRNRREVGWVGQNGAAPAPSVSDTPSSASSAEQSVSAGKAAGTGGASGSW